VTAPAHRAMLAALRRHIASWRVIFVFGTVYFLSQAAIGVLVQPLGSEMLAVQTTLSAERVRAIFAGWDAVGLVDVYAAHYRYDMVHPFWYGVFLAALLARGFDANRVPANRNALLLLPFVASGFDVLENLIHLTFIADRTNITPAAVLIANGAALTKWAIAGGSVVAVTALTLNALRRREHSQ